MSQISFWRGGVLLASVEACEGDLLIDVARFHEVPLHWRCGQGTCGTCVVHVSHAAQPAHAQLGGKERNVLLRAGFCTAAAAREPQWDDLPDTPRLACHLKVAEQDWQVHLVG